ncbi:MAG: hypothetical protein KGJ66_03095 [Alphaproteobacteria bacterium]|nr:hypothetical protein [Alphaproteobacteria bacterium]
MSARRRIWPALAIALAVITLAVPARAETMAIACEGVGRFSYGGTWYYDVDLNRDTITTRADGKVYPAQITKQKITYGSEPGIYSIDRLTGQEWLSGGLIAICHRFAGKPAL